MNSDSDPVGSYSEDLAAFQEVLPKRYQILREVGRGGMGQVLLAIDRGPNLDRHRMVAIKRMLGSYLGDLESVKRFYDEIDLARDLRHPNVVKMYHSDETRLGPYIVMEYIEGKDLGVYIQERGPLSEPQAVVWFTKLAEALDEGHRKGLIHRDIKPGNILISQEGEPYLTDFGIARRISAMDKTGTGLGAGTIEYISLEQLRNSRSVSSQDIYSFGATLFHAVEGRPPFESTNLVDFITRLASESAPRAIRVSTKLADRIASCLEKNPAERPSSCQAVLAGMVADPPVVPVVVPPISAENKPAAARQPAASEQTVASRVETQTQRRFGMKGITFIGLLGLFLWWLAVSGSWNRDVGRTKNDLVTESSPSKEVVAPTVDSNAAMSESKKAAESVKPEPKETAELPIRLTNSLGMEFRLIQPGMFMMGTPENETGPFSNETQHRITCTKPFYLGVYEVTQGEWEKLMGSQPSYFQNQNLSVQVIIPEKQERFPVENISWIEANVFCETLTSKERRAGRISDDLVYRLPTEDEWWTVAGRDVPSIEENQAWFSANSNNRSHEVGLLTPNALGIFDLFGNVEEMTTTLILDEKSGEKTCSVLGGSWFSQPSGFDDLNERRSNYLDSTRNFQGFRVVLGSALGIE